MYPLRALLLLAALGQDPASPGPVLPPAPAPPVEAEPVAPPPPVAPAARPTPAAPRPAAEVPAPGPKVRGAEEVQRALKKLGELPPAEQPKALEALRAEHGGLDSNPVLPPADLDLARYLGLAPVDQARVTARHFVADLIAADASGLLAHCGFPFFLEDLRVDRPEELRALWARSLKSKRTDLLAFLDLEVLTPAEMEKKYGPPPRRLGGWGWRAPGALLAVANLSGHAAVLLLRPAGAAWQVVGYHD